ncbi:SDR family oxidoreductase [Pseudonocardia kunmingensis]|uniref:NADP-dependent 3-hydroxy acid dehydrogenase YdfG n=1 Tax=Pseudonocardia kunmingensis TaxID=630975 RepID=A0A543DKC5_9PSEU|nr:SDR family NAD(P)-dependent oxidoreductase [Pseudonocardia kunmingensis]TQM09783.1 NADP-dependent 3-hydroxy acid dehydrogenase YdfG [Pseudonocardia kunmingensis]
MDLTGKGALVTGGASGIGAAAARRLAGAGARVAVADRDEAAAAALVEELGGLALGGDVADPERMPAHVAAAEEAFGRLDVVLLNAGVTGGQSGVEELDLAAYRRIVGVNVDHVVFGLTAAVPALRRAGGGTVIATASLAGLVAMPGDALYTMTKHAVVGYVRSAAPTLAPEGIRVNAVCPGFADTPLLARAKDRFAGFPLLTAEDVADAIDAVLERGEPGECWFVQPGREPAPYGFRGVPGPAGAPRPPDVDWSDH